jgi:hypothetical protein
MMRREVSVRRWFGLLAAAVLLVHLAAGLGLTHARLDPAPLDPASPNAAATVIADATSEPTFVGCVDIGACVRAGVPDAAWTATVGLGLTVGAIGLALSHRQRVVRRPRWRVGPAPPPHLSSQVVLLI